jgi:SAM-dependent methyltransferase
LGGDTISTENRIDEWVENELHLNDDGVFQCVGSASLAYSDGRDNELYLHRAFDNCQDLGTGSRELESWIKDWPTEYHLSRKRAQLLSGFDFDSSAKVLEVGCGCGAITRFLGETFDEVVSVEGSVHRAALARKRCRDLDSVSILSAPFQTIKFKRKFDIIFCIGVFEYSKAFVEGDDPYAQIIEYFADYLTEDGVLVLAIENQFGLKYFASASEDHTKARYDGLEGYPRYADRARTFGYQQLKDYLLRRFSKVDYYFPFPDYKVPEAVLAESLFEAVDASPLLASFQSRDYLRPYKPRFDERLVWPELVANQQAHFFANSFIAVAAKDVAATQVAMKDLAVLYNRGRAEPFHTHTRVYIDADDGGVMVEKTPFGTDPIEQGNFSLRGYREAWQPGLTVHRQVLQGALDRGASLAEIFAPARHWYAALAARVEQGVLPGDLVDAVWQNSFAGEDRLVHIDSEWVYHQPLSLNVLLIRAVYRFMVDARSYPMLASTLRFKRSRTIILAVASELGATLSAADFEAFLALESELQSTALGRPHAAVRRNISLLLALPQQAIRGLQFMDRQLGVLRFYFARVIRIARRLYRDRG